MELRGAHLDGQRGQVVPGVRRDGPLHEAEIARADHADSSRMPRLGADPVERGQPVGALVERAERALQAEGAAHALDQHLQAALGEQPAEDQPEGLTAPGQLPCSGARPGDGRGARRAGLPARRGSALKRPRRGTNPGRARERVRLLADAGGRGQTVAIVDAFDDPKIEADLTTFDAATGCRPAQPPTGASQKVNQSGNPTPLPGADKVGWSVEMSLDVETVHSVCPTCKIVLVEANSRSLADLENDG